MSTANAIDRIDRELDERLRTAQARIAELETELTAAQQIRQAIIGEAMAARWSHARIAEVLGLSKQRVTQLGQRDETG